MVRLLILALVVGILATGAPPPRAVAAAGPPLIGEALDLPGWLPLQGILRIQRNLVLGPKALLRSGADAGWSDEELIRFALEADRRLFLVTCVANPERIRREGFEPVPIKSREDLQALLGAYWDPKYIEELWQEGQRGPLPFGFYTDGDFYFHEARDIKVANRTANTAVVTGVVGPYPMLIDPVTGDVIEELGPFTLNIHLRKTSQGWQAYWPY